MNRRTLLGAIGSVGSLTALWYATQPPVSDLEVRFWLSEQAATYDGVADRITDYLEYALDLEFWRVDVSYGGVYAADTEDGAAVTRSGEWPLALGLGATGQRDLEPASDVNLLVTDGQMQRTPTGFALPHIASVGGVRYIADLEPIDALAQPAAYTTPNRVVQVLIHEVGHTLGLRHEHGLIYTDEDATVSTPMVSTYAWSTQFDAEHSRCGTPYPTDRSRDRKLTHTFSACSKERLEQYSGGLRLE